MQMIKARDIVVIQSRDIWSGQLERFLNLQKINHKLHSSRFIRNPIQSDFLWITLSNFLWNSEILLIIFVFRETTKLYTSSLTVCLYLLGNLLLYTFFLHLGSILGPNLKWGSLQRFSIPPSSWNSSLNFCRSLLKRCFEPSYM